MSATPVESSQPTGAHAPFTVVDVWLEAGRDGRTFTYGDYQQLGLSLGDLVVVRLRGRRLQGLVTASRPFSEDDLQRSKPLQPVDALLQRAAVDADWRDWLDAMAAESRQNSPRMGEHQANGLAEVTGRHVRDQVRVLKLHLEKPGEEGAGGRARDVLDDQVGCYGHAQVQEGTRCPHAVPAPEGQEM